MIKKLIPIVATALFSVPGLNAAVIGVEWGGSNIVTAQQELNLPAGTDYTTTRVWSRTENIALTPTSNYNATAFYGVIQYSKSGTPTNLSTAAILNRNDGNGDRFYLQAPSNAAAAAESLAGLVYVKKADFINSLNTSASVRFDEESSMSLTIANIAAGGTGGVRTVRMAVLNGGQWYVSQSYASSVTTLTISNLLTQSWAVYPADVRPLGGTFTLDYDTLGSELTDIQAAGVYFLNSHTGSTTPRDFAFDKFEVSFASIPEPSSVALLGAAAAGAGVLLRKKR